MTWEHFAVQGSSSALKCGELFSTVVYTLNLLALSSVLDQRSSHAGHRSGTAPHAQFWSSARLCPPLTRHSPSLSLSLSPSLLLFCGKQHKKKLRAAQFISTLKAAGFAGRRNGLGDSWPWNHLQSNAGGNGCVYSQWRCVPRQTLIEPSHRSYQGCQALLLASWIWACSNKTWMSKKKLPKLTLFSWTSRRSCRCFMRISTNIKPVCSFSLFFFFAIPAFVVLFEVVWSLRSCQRLSEMEPLVWVRGCVFDVSDVPWMCSHV